MGNVNFKCKKCNVTESYDESEIYWQSVGACEYKLCKCKHCGSIQIIKEVEDKNLNVNRDLRFYEYS